jgi:Xaa-Pro aminopeptidase
VTSPPCAARRHALVALLAHDGLDALLVQHLPNIRYLTGFTGSAALLLVMPDVTVLVTDFRYASQAPQEAQGVDVQVDPTSIWDRLGRVLAAHAVDRLGVESHVMTTRDAERVSRLTRARVVPVTELVEQLRAAKDAGEVASIRAAAALAAEALSETLPTIRPGDREIDVAARLEAALRRRGSEWHPFQTIVASGPRAALPHARSSVREVGRDEMLLIDFGAQVDGYCADLTRTVVVGRADEQQRTVYAIVAEAQARARSAIRARQPGRDADALAREVIAARGFGDAFGHSLGHGLGLEVHEAPRLSQTNEAPLPMHAVVTIEPGIYLPGWGGVRLEDDVYLGPEGPELLSDGRTDLLELTW